MYNFTGNFWPNYYHCCKGSIRYTRSLRANNELLSFSFCEVITPASHSPLCWRDSLLSGEQCGMRLENVHLQATSGVFPLGSAAVPGRVKPGPPGWPGRCLCFQGLSLWKEGFFLSSPSSLAWKTNIVTAILFGWNICEIKHAVSYNLKTRRK